MSRTSTSALSRQRGTVFARSAKRVVPSKNIRKPRAYCSTAASVIGAASTRRGCTRNCTSNQE
ncbi:hypothetical protein LOK49_LG07G00081 [Camellia lanceoleosa]|uniref:Uncharacterized protein n=1 Tax=Camellia lanceoleosa TaxID=1840588 RepID=A0ACC0H527_9ERIC|nr:hypothetical protein LOK49_LG07G00081 [Camellia lanceoleosa]